MNCPNCKKNMELGYIQTNGSFLTFKNRNLNIPLTADNSLGTKSYYCKLCDSILIFNKNKEFRF